MAENRQEPASTQDVLGHAMSEYKKGPLTPELVNSTWKAIWETWGQRVNHTFQVPSCDRTSEELTQLQKKGKEILMLPDELYAKDGLVILGRIFPFMDNNWTTREIAEITNEHDKGGSMDVEMGFRTLNTNSNEIEEMDIHKKENRIGIRLATYIVGSQFSKLLTGLYFDESTWSPIRGSRTGRDRLDAGFDSYGRLVVNSPPLTRQINRGMWGVRSEGVKKA